MRLDSKAMTKIRHLEREYGQLSNVPSSHPYINRLSKYGKNTPPPLLDTLLSFYLTKDEMDKATEITNKLNKVRTTEIREWIVDYIYNPSKINTAIPIPKEERFTLNVYKKDFEELSKLASKNDMIFNEFAAIIVKTKISELYKEF